MDETIDQIEAHIDQTRQRLGSNLQELERRVDAAIDWREQFRARPYMALGVAFAGGVAIATVLRHRAPGQRFSPSMEAAVGAPRRNGSDTRQQALEVWNNIKGALIGVATTRVKDFIGEAIPGFHEHFQRAEQRTAASRGPAPARTDGRSGD
jgi:Protein of unknown function (DUF3618)